MEEGVPQWWQDDLPRLQGVRQCSGGRGERTSFGRACIGKPLIMHLVEVLPQAEIYLLMDNDPPLRRDVLISILLC